MKFKYLVIAIIVWSLGMAYITFRAIEELPRMFGGMVREFNEARLSN